eukprot:CAMPEP_0180494148 /NCGR_PEP_ID=MMETSP1036_2-20121128/41085_1 /TAXON_ID=632150 /ORGANISM="Azadinium spinosum, Strain 3D9" /LENGTH=75 /DNA_ID=CAMNT_0022502571 /DNA_START=32 /DNA_END=256 /DNA_ORIENTATION=-
MVDIKSVTRQLQERIDSLSKENTELQAQALDVLSEMEADKSPYAKLSSENARLRVILASLSCGQTMTTGSGVQDP